MWASPRTENLSIEDRRRASKKRAARLQAMEKQLRTVETELARRRGRPSTNDQSRSNDKNVAVTTYNPNRPRPRTVVRRPATAKGFTKGMF